MIKVRLVMMEPRTLLLLELADPLAAFPLVVMELSTPTKSVMTETDSTWTVVLPSARESVVMVNLT